MDYIRIDHWRDLKNCSCNIPWFFSTIHNLWAYGLGNMLILVVIQAFSFGFANGLNSLVSAAYSDQQYYMCGLHLNRALIVNTVIYVIQSAILLFCKQILSTFCQEEEIIHLTSIYIYIMLFGQYWKVQFETIRCFLQAQKIYWLTTKILTVTTILHLVTCYLTIYRFKLGVIGAAIANSSFHILTLVLIMIYLTRRRYSRLHPNAWHRFNQDSMNNLGEYFKNGFQYGIMRWLDLWGFQCILICSSWVGEKEFATYVIIQACTQFTLQIPLGVGISSWNLITHSIIMLYPKKVKMYSKIAMFWGLISGFGIGAVYEIFGVFIIKWFTFDTSIQEVFHSILPYIALHQIFDHIQAIETGVIKSLNRQRHAGIALIVIMFGWGLPVAYELAFGLKWGFIGVYIGLIVGTALISIYFSILISFFTNWEDLTKKITTLAEQSNEEVEVAII